MQAVAALHLGEVEKARSLLARGLDISLANRDEGGIFSGLIAFAGLALADRQYQTAARLLGYMEPKLVDIIQKMEFYDKIEFDHHTARVKEALDEADLAACWAEGRAITLEQAINMARRLGGGTTTISSSVAVVFLS